MKIQITLQVCGSVFWHHLHVCTGEMLHLSANALIQAHISGLVHQFIHLANEVEIINLIRISTFWVKKNLDLQ